MRIVFLLSFLFPVLIACKRDKTPEQAVDTHVNKLELHAKFNSQVFNLDSVYTFSDGTKIQFTTCKFYLSNITCGSQVLADYALFDWSVNPTLIFQKEGILPNSDTLNFGIGVPSTVNHNDPSVWPSTNPLNILIANDMHWDWNPGYIFIKIEAKADTLVDGNLNLNHLISYHVGMDAFYLTKQLTGANWQTNGTISSLNLTLDLEQIFANPSNLIHINTEHTTHSSPGEEVLTGKVRDNFVAAMALE